MNRVLKVVALYTVEAVLLGGVLLAAVGHVTSPCDSCGDLYYSKGHELTSCDECYQYNTFVAPYLPDTETAAAGRAGK